MIKIVLLFVGAVIGAGFATGSEIMLYFGASGVGSIVISSIIMGGLCVLYGIFGKVISRYPWCDAVQKVLVFVASVVMYIIMLSGSDSIVYHTFGVRCTGIITGVVTALLLLYDMRTVKWVNGAVVGVIIVLMCALVCRVHNDIHIGVDMQSSFLYAGMNMLLGGYIMSSEGKKYSTHKLCIMGGMVAVVMCGLMTMCYAICSGARGESMPLYAMASRIGWDISAAVIIYCAIFTTLISSSRVVSDMLIGYGVSRWWVVLAFVLLAMYAVGMDFDSAVAKCYPPIGWLGVGYVCLMCVVLCVHTAKRARAWRRL